MAALQSKLRLSSVKDGDALAMIEEAVRDARISFYDRLAAARVGEIVAIVYTDAPVNAEQVLRMKAAVTEAKLVRLQILRTMPSMTVEASPADQQAWNQEGFLRDTRPDEIAREIKRLTLETDQYLQDLEGEAPTPSALNVSTIGPTRDPMPLPGESINPTKPRLYDGDPPQGA